MPLNLIEQTSKTILFEEFDTDRVDLNTIITQKTDEDGDDYFFKKVKENNLEVYSYEEFVKNFMPTIWQWTEVVIGEDGSQQMLFRYSVENPRNEQAKPMNLQDNEFYNMIIDLYNQKSASGKSNDDFDYSSVEQFLSPQKVLDNAKKLRKALEFNENELQKLPETAKMERNKYIGNIQENRRQIISQYKESFTGCLTLALADVNQTLLHIEESKKQSSGSSLNLESKKPCLIGFDENGDIRISPIEEKSTEVAKIEQENKANLINIISQDFDKYSGIEQDNNGLSFMRDTVLATYCGQTSPIATLDEAVLISKRDNLTYAYKEAREQFIRAVSGVVEKMLNVKVFFENATVNGKLPFSLIVSNCKATTLVEDEKSKNAFEAYLKKTSEQVDSGKIWFAILPAIGDKDLLETAIEPERSLDDDLYATVDGDIDTLSGQKLVSLNHASIVLGMLAKYKIVTFFNYKANEKTGVSKLNVSRVEDYKDRLSNLKGNKYAVFTYPNFSLLPKKETTIKIGSVRNTDTNEDKTVTIDIPGVYVDSSYVAAGLVVGTQNPDYLVKKGLKVKPKNPCVRFNIEDHIFDVLTTMNREISTQWDKELAGAITKDLFGFCFCSNKIFQNGKEIKNTYVFQARNMAKQGIYTTLLTDFIVVFLDANVISRGENVYNMKNIKACQKDFLNKWKRDSDVETFCNNLLNIGENIEYDEKNGKFLVQLKDNNKDIPLEIALDISTE